LIHAAFSHPPFPPEEGKKTTKRGPHNAPKTFPFGKASKANKHEKKTRERTKDFKRSLTVCQENRINLIRKISG